MKISLAELEQKCSQFKQLEKRGTLYTMFLNMIEKGFEVEAMLFILSTWNFATFRYAIKTFDIDGFKEVIHKCKPVFEKLGNKTFENTNFDEIQEDIKYIYNSLSVIKGIKYTGTPKLMHLKNPRLFIMWDSYIKKKYGYKKGTAEEYIQFLKQMQTIFNDIKWENKNKTLAKAIDEYNYLTITMEEMNKKKNNK